LGTYRGESSFISIVKICFAKSCQLGLAAVPALPYLFDKPVEQVVEKVFHEGFRLIGGPQAVGEGVVPVPVQARPDKEKEL
jgi:hypothetical protein